MRLHSSYSLGTHTVCIEAPGLPGNAVSAVKLTMGTTCVLVSVTLQPDRLRAPDPTRLAVNLSRASGDRSGRDLSRNGAITEFDEGLTELIRLVVNAVVPETLAPRLRLMIRVLSTDPQTQIDVPVLQALGVALHLLKELRAPLATAVRVACLDTRLVLMPSKTQRLVSDLDFVAVVTRAGLVLLRAQARDVPHAVLVGAVDRVQASLLPVYEAVEAMASNTGSFDPNAHQIRVEAEELGEVASGLERAVQAASQFSAVSARRMAMRAVSTRCASRLQTLGQRFESGQIDRVLQRMERNSVRQRLLAGEGRFDGRSASDPGSMALHLQPQVDGRRAVLIHSGRTQTCVTAAPDVSINRASDAVDADAALSDVFLKFNPTSVARVEHPQGSGAKHRWTDLKGEFFPFVSMALEPVMHRRVRVSAYATPALSCGFETPGSAMTGVGGGCLAMLGAGAPIQAWVAGADLGLMAHGDAQLVLADPLAAEEPLLDAHLKLASTCHGLTAVQLVANTPGIPLRLLETALAQGVDLSRSRLVEMRAALADMPSSVAPPAPHSQTLHIDPALTHELMVRRRDAITELCEAIGASIRVDGRGVVTITAPSSKLLEMACRQFKAIAGDAQKNGATVEAVVVEVIEFFGVRLATTDGRVALLHSSRMTPSTLNHGLDVGDTITVRLLGQDVLGSYRAEMPSEPEQKPDEPAASS